MSGTDTPQAEPPFDDEFLAAEYVLHLLDAEARRSFEARLAAEPALREEVHRWEAHFASLAEEVPETAPPARVKAALMAQIDAAPEGPAGVRRIFSAWRMGFGALAAALVLVATLVLVPILTRPDFSPAYHVDLASADGDLFVAAGLDAEQNLLLIRRDQGAPRPGRALELWLIAEGAEAPVSLGVLPDENEIFVTLPAELVQQFAGATLAISDEPEGGSPTGAPTGAVLAAAAVETL